MVWICVIARFAKTMSTTLMTTAAFTASATPRGPPLASMPRSAEMIATIAANTMLFAIANHTSVIFANVPNELQKLPGATPLTVTARRNAAPVPAGDDDHAENGRDQQERQEPWHHETPDRVHSENPHGVEFFAHGARPEVGRDSRGRGTAHQQPRCDRAHPAGQHPLHSPRQAAPSPPLRRPDPEVTTVTIAPNGMAISNAGIAVTLSNTHACHKNS